MTNGVVVVLGEVGRNFAAGMTGGRAYVLDFDLLGARINSELVEVVPLTSADVDEARALVTRHLRYTGSPTAQRLLDNWEAESGRLRLIVPSADAARVESEHEGTAPVEANETAAAEVGK